MREIKKALDSVGISIILPAVANASEIANVNTVSIDELTKITGAGQRVQIKNSPPIFGGLVHDYNPAKSVGSLDNL